MKKMALFLSIALLFTGVSGANAVELKERAASVKLQVKVDQKQAKPKEVPFETIEKGSMSSIKERKYVVILDQASWMKLWSQVHAYQNPMPPAPTVDFSKDMVIAVFQGEKPTGGYSIDIDRIMVKNKRLHVAVTESSPGMGCVVSQVITSPYEMVKTKRVEDKVAFKTDYLTYQCRR